MNFPSTLKILAKTPANLDFLCACGVWFASYVKCAKFGRLWVRDLTLASDSQARQVVCRNRLQLIPNRQQNLDFLGACLRMRCLLLKIREVWEAFSSNYSRPTQQLYCMDFNLGETGRKKSLPQFCYLLSNCTSQSTNNAYDEYKYHAVCVLQRTG